LGISTGSTVVLGFIFIPKVSNHRASTTSTAGTTMAVPVLKEKNGSTEERMQLLTCSLIWP